MERDELFTEIFKKGLLKYGNYKLGFNEYKDEFVISIYGKNSRGMILYFRENGETLNIIISKRSGIKIRHYSDDMDTVMIVDKL
jgi:hypothetical protein